MPKPKPSPIKAQAEIVQANIRARGAYFNCYTDREFEKKLGISNSTFCRRRANPQQWTLEQLIMISIALKCSLQWLMTDHSGEIKGETS